MSKVTLLPVGAQIRFVQDFIQREKKMRSMVLTGRMRDQKMADADDAIECMNSIEKHCRPPIPEEA